MRARCGATRVGERVLVPAKQSGASVGDVTGGCSTGRKGWSDRSRTGRSAGEPSGLAPLLAPLRQIRAIYAGGGGQAAEARQRLAGTSRRIATPVHGPYDTLPRGRPRHGGGSRRSGRSRRARHHMFPPRLLRPSAGQMEARWLASRPRRSPMGARSSTAWRGFSLAVTGARANRSRSQARRNAAHQTWLLPGHRGRHRAGKPSPRGAERQCRACRGAPRVRRRRMTADRRVEPAPVRPTGVRARRDRAVDAVRDAATVPGTTSDQGRNPGHRWSG